MNNDNKSYSVPFTIDVIQKEKNHFCFTVQYKIKWFFNTTVNTLFYTLRN